MSNVHMVDDEDFTYAINWELDWAYMVPFTEVKVEVSTNGKHWVDLVSFTLEDDWEERIGNFFGNEMKTLEESQDYIKQLSKERISIDDTPYTERVFENVYR